MNLGNFILVDVIDKKFEVSSLCPSRLYHFTFNKSVSSMSLAIAGLNSRLVVFHRAAREMGWDGEKEIKYALKELLASKSASNSRVKAVADIALKYSREYKRIVYSIEQVIWKSKPKQRFGGLCSMDAVLRQSRLKNGSKDVYAKRFLQHLTETIRAISEIPDKQQDQVKRVVQEWQKQGFYSKEDIKEAGGQDHGYVNDGAEVGVLLCC